MKLAWHSALTGPERRTFWAYFGSFGLDPMGATMYGLVIPSLIATLRISRPEAVPITGISGYLAMNILGSLSGPLMYGWLPTGRAI